MDFNKKCIVSKKVLEKKEISFCDYLNNKWIFLQGDEDDEYILNEENLEIITLQEVIEIEKYIENILLEDIKTAYYKDDDGYFIIYNFE